MSLLKRLSDTFWNLVSPRRETVPSNVSSQTAPTFKKPALPNQKRGPLQDVVEKSRSISPTSRVDSWRATYSADRASSSVSNKRKRKVPVTPIKGAGRRRKFVRMDAEDIEYASSLEDNSDSGTEITVLSDDDDEDIERDNELVDGKEIDIDVDRFTRSPSAIRSIADFDTSESEINTSLLVSEQDYDGSPNRVKVISPTKEQFAKGVSTEVLREQGWDDDHIVLVQKIAMRGFEPLLPKHFKFGWPWMPDALFSRTGDAFVGSLRGDHYRAIKALEKLFELGGRVRDCIVSNGKVQPEEKARRMLNDFIKWGNEDSGLDHKAAIPLLALECKPGHVPADVIKANARRKLEKLAARFKEAFSVSQSIEDSPESKTSTVLSYPMPTLYAFVASHTLIALVAYRPEKEDADIESVAFFDMKDKDYDVWNALALAITVCHVSNVQIRIAEDTGIGMKSSNARDEKEDMDDPDL